MLKPGSRVRRRRYFRRIRFGAEKLEPRLPLAADQVGVFRGNSDWYLDLDRDSAHEIDLFYGLADKGDIPIVGDWDGDGDDDPGVVTQDANRNGKIDLPQEGLLTWYLDTDGDPDPEITFQFGFPTDKPVVGNWDGKGGDNVGIVRPLTIGAFTYWEWYFDTNQNPDVEGTPFYFGFVTDTPVVGNWDGQGGDNAGVVRDIGGDLTWYFDTNNDPHVDASTVFGSRNEQPIPGDWDGDGDDDPGIFRDKPGQTDPQPIVWKLSTDSGVQTVNYGFNGDTPISGRWGQPEIKVTHGGNEIFGNHSATIDFNTVVKGQAKAGRTFTITNEGNAPLTTSTSIPPGYVVVDPLKSKLLGGASDTFQIQLDNKVLGEKRGDVVIGTNDGNERYFTFEVVGKVSGPLALVTDFATAFPIHNGQSGVVDMGAVNQDVLFNYSFWLDNDGDLPLVVNNIDLPNGFDLASFSTTASTRGEVFINSFPTTISPGGVGRFTIQLDTTELGNFGGTLSIFTNEGFGSPYRFDIRATVGFNPFTSEIGVFRKREWLLDTDRDVWQEFTIPYGLVGDVPVTGDWDGDGTTNLGVFRTNPDGTFKDWFLDLDHDPEQEITHLFGAVGDIPVVGDWDGNANGDLRDHIGIVTKDGNRSCLINPADTNCLNDDGGILTWYLDLNGDPTPELTFEFGHHGDIPIVGDWNGDGKSDIGVVTKDFDRNGKDDPSGLFTWIFRHSDTLVRTQEYGLYSYGDIPVVGDWDGNGVTDIGVVTNDHDRDRVPDSLPLTWYLDLDDDPAPEQTIFYGLPGDVPVVGRWLPGDRRARITGIKWNDLDNDGVRDLNEPGIPNLKVFLDNDDDGVLDPGEITTTTTVDDPSTEQDEAGHFAFEGLRPGTYFVNSERGPSFEQSFPSAAGRFSQGDNASLANEEFARAADAQAKALNASATNDSTIPPFNSDGSQANNNHLGQIKLDDLLAHHEFSHLDGAGYSIVVIDTGVVDHATFFGNRVVESIDLFDADGVNPIDINGHGVHVTSIAASSDATYGGVAPGANIIHLKIFPDAPGQSSNELVLEKALNWVVNHAATLNIAAVNMSLAAGNFANATSVHALADEFASLAALRIIPVGAAGNSFTASQPGIAFPASDPNVVSVGAVDANDAIASFSQRQNGLLDILAPGVDISGAGLDGSRAVLRGTSQAAPQVAGAALLAQQLADEHLGRRLTTAEFVDVIQSSKIIVQDPILKHQGGAPFEYRRLDVLAMAEAILEIAPTNGHGAYKVKVAASDSVGVEFGDIDPSSVPDPKGVISGRLYGDVNGNGVFDGGETALAGWTVFLDKDGDQTFDAVDEPFRVTGGDGRFELTDLEADHYTVHAKAPIDGKAWKLTNPLGISAESQLIFGDDEPSDVAIADLNQDGTSDVVVTAAAGNVVNLFLTGGDNIRLQLESFVRPDRVLVVNANGDTHPDLLVTNSFDGRATLLINDPDVGFDAVTPKVIHIGGSQTSLAAGDLNHDGVEDIVVVHDTRDNSNVTILLNDGQGNYGVGQNRIAVTAAPNATDIVVTDIDADGKDDIAVATFGNGIGNGEVIVLFNNAPNNRRPTSNDFERQVYRTGFSIGALAAARLGSGNTVDLVAVNSLSQSLTLLEFNGQDFDTSAIDNIGPDLVDVAATDVNHDGLVDLVVASGRGGAVYILTQSASGEFNPPVQLDVAGQFELSENSRLAVGEIQGGGLPELVVTIPAKDRLAIATLAEVAGPHRVRVATADTVVQGLEFGARIENLPPTLNDINPVQVDEDPLAPVVVELTGVGDGNDNTQNLTFTIQTSNPSLIPANAISDVSWDGGSHASFTFRPAVNKHGTAELIVAIQDDGGTVNADVDTTTRTVQVSVKAVNDPPVADSQTVVATEDTDLAVVLTGSDVEGSELAFTFGRLPTNGVLIGTAPNLIYRPNLHFDQSDSFTFSVYDGELDAESLATVTIEFIAVNDRPVANSQDVTTTEDTNLEIVLTGNDIEGTAITYEIVASPAQGTLTGVAPELVYTPFANSVGKDEFTFRVSDGTSLSDIATVGINVTAINDPPVADDQTINMSKGNSVEVTLTGSDIENSPLEFTIARSPTHGVLSGSPPNLTYTPASDFTGTDSFTFVASDGELESVAATVSIRVNGTNSSPTASNATLETDEDTPATVLLPIDDADGLETLELELQSDDETVSAAVALTANGFELTFDPSKSLQLQELSKEETATRTVTYTARDTEGAAATGTLTITVHGLNDWQNPQDRADVNANGSVEPLDVLLIINTLNDEGPRPLTGVVGQVERFYDVSGDNSLSPIDALIVINRINDVDGAEGEPQANAAFAEMTFAVEPRRTRAAKRELFGGGAKVDYNTTPTQNESIDSPRNAKVEERRAAFEKEWARWDDLHLDSLEDVIDEMLGG